MLLALPAGQSLPCAPPTLSQSFPARTGHITQRVSCTLASLGCGGYESISLPRLTGLRPQRRGYKSVSPYRVKITATTSRTTDSARTVPTYPFPQHQLPPYITDSARIVHTLQKQKIEILSIPIFCKIVYLRFNLKDKILGV